MKRYLVLLILSLFSINVFAHPTSFKGSVGVMGYHTPSMTHNQINYSWQHWFATGLHHFSRPQLVNRHGTFATTNFLLHRWNTPHLQANIYANFGIGQSELSANSKTMGLGLVQFDIEDREYYFLAKHLELTNFSKPDLVQSVVRAGIAPYVAGFESLHTWIILEWSSSEFSELEKDEDLTPFLRLFYNNILFEIGQSYNGVTKFNYISHF